MSKDLSFENNAEWTMWRGGSCPGDPQSGVEAMTADGTMYRTYAKCLDWSHAGYLAKGRIVKYRPCTLETVGTEPIDEKLVHRFFADSGAEIDPSGKDAHTAGAKLDAGKNRLGLVLGAFSRALQAVGEVGTYGANKYTDNGWVSVPNGEARYTDALYRHLLKEAAGEMRDADTGLLHAAHAAWNALARLDLAIREHEAGAQK